MKRIRITVWPRILGFGVLLLLVREGRGADDQGDLLAMVRAGHRAARESIRSISATVSLEETFPQKEFIRSGKYWRSLDTVRVQEGHGGRTSDEYLMKDSKIRHVGLGRDPRTLTASYKAIRKPDSD